MNYKQINNEQFEKGYEVLLSYLNNLSNNILDQINIKDQEYTLAKIIDKEIQRRHNLTIEEINKENLYEYSEYLEDLRIEVIPNSKDKTEKELNDLTTYSPYLKRILRKTNDITDFKNIQSTKNYTLLNLLDANPFDNLKNLNGNLSSNLFFKHLFVKTKAIERLDKEINLEISSNYSNKNFIFLTGMAGTGKTTFINYFISKNNQYKHDYYNCESYSPIINFSDTFKTSTVFGSIFKRKLFEITDKEILPAFNYIIANKSFLFSYLPDVYYKIEKYLVKKSVSDRDDKTFIDLIFSFDDYEISILYFLIKIFNKIALDEENIEEILYFDNLDSFPQYLLNDSLLDFFPKLYVSINNIVSTSSLVFKSIDFSNKYKFLFCLREHNLSYLNSHTFDRIISNSYNKKLSLFNDNVEFKSIVNKRLDFYNEISTKYENEKVSSFYFSINKMINSNWIFENIQSIYNYDFRKVINFLSIEANEMASNPEISETALENIITFNLSKRLKKSSILRKYNAEELNYYSQYCNVERILLTVLLNLSKNNRVSESIEVPLFDVVKYFNKSQLVDKELIYEVLSEMLNKNLFEQINFIGLNDTSYASHNISLDTKGMFSEALMCKDINRQELLVSKIESKYLSIYPAAVRYVDTFSIHFEFYAALVGNNTSLFDISSYNDKELIYSVKNSIKNVIDLIKEEIKYIDKIFGETYDLNKYDNAKYEFGFSFKNVKKSLSHITRVIVAHITYLEKYRQFIIKQDLNKDSKMKINKLIINYIKEYSVLLGAKISLTQEKEYINNITTQIENTKSNEDLKITTPNNLYK